MEAFVSTEDLARRYNVRPATAQSWLAASLLPGERLGGRWYTSWDHVFAFEGRLCPPQGSAREAAKRPLLTVDDLAACLSARPATVRRWLRQGALPGILIRGSWYVDRLDLERTLAFPTRSNRKLDQTTGKPHTPQAGTGR